MHPAKNSATRALGVVFEALCFWLSSTSSKFSTDGGLVGGSGESPDGVAAHGCEAAGGADGRAIIKVDNRADSAAEDRNLFCIGVNKILSFLSRNVSKLSVCYLVKPAMVRRATSLYEDHR